MKKTIPSEKNLTLLDASQIPEKCSNKAASSNSHQRAKVHRSVKLPR